MDWHLHDVIPDLIRDPGDSLRQLRPSLDPESAAPRRLVQDDGVLFAPLPSPKRRPPPLALSPRPPYLRPMTGFDDITADFEFLDDWDERYKYIIDLGRTLAPYPEEERDEAHKVRGCASQVWLSTSINQNNKGALLTFAGDSDAHIVKGLVALLIALYSDKTPAEILIIDAKEKLAPLDLEGHLTPQRSNGVASMIKRIRAIAEAA